MTSFEIGEPIAVFFRGSYWPARVIGENECGNQTVLNSKEEDHAYLIKFFGDGSFSWHSEVSARKNFKSAYFYNFEREKKDAEYTFGLEQALREYFDFLGDHPELEAKKRKRMSETNRQLPNAKRRRVSEMDYIDITEDSEDKANHKKATTTKKKTPRKKKKAPPMKKKKKKKKKKRPRKRKKKIQFDDDDDTSSSDDLSMTKRRGRRRSKPKFDPHQKKKSNEYADKLLVSKRLRDFENNQQLNTSDSDSDDEDLDDDEEEEDVFDQNDVVHHPPMTRKLPLIQMSDHEIMESKKRVEYLVTQTFQNSQQLQLMNQNQNKTSSSQNQEIMEWVKRIIQKDQSIEQFRKYRFPQHINKLRKLVRDRDLQKRFKELLYHWRLLLQSKLSQNQPHSQRKFGSSTSPTRSLPSPNEKLRIKKTAQNDVISPEIEDCFERNFTRFRTQNSTRDYGCKMIASGIYQGRGVRIEHQLFPNDNNNNNNNKYKSNKGFVPSAMRCLELGSNMESECYARYHEDTNMRYQIYLRQIRMIYLFSKPFGSKLALQLCDGSMSPVKVATMDEKEFQRIKDQK